VLIIIIIIIRHVKNREIAYLNERSPDFDKIWYTNADLEVVDAHMTKYENF